MERHLLLVGASASLSSGAGLAVATDAILPALRTAFGSTAAAFSNSEFQERTDTMFATMFKRLGSTQGRAGPSAAPSALLRGMGAVPAARCSKDEGLEISDTLGMLETNGANSKLERRQVGKKCTSVHLPERARRALVDAKHRPSEPSRDGGLR